MIRTVLAGRPQPEALPAEDAEAILQNVRKEIAMCNCSGKDGKRKKLYFSEYEATEMAELRSRETGITMHVYKCPEGEGWHITSNQRQW